MKKFRATPTVRASRPKVARRKTGSNRAPLFACASALVVVAFTAKAAAGSFYWDSLNKNWSDTDGQDWLTNFSGLGGTAIAAPSPTDPTNLLFFGDSTSFTSTNDLGDNFQANGITLSNTSATADTIAGNSISFVSNGSNPFVTQSGNGSVSFTDNWVLTNPLTLNGTGTGVTTIGGVVSGGSLLTVSGASWLANNLNNSWTGGTTITAGAKLEVTNAAANFDLLAAGNSLLGSGGTVTINGGTLRITTSGTGTFNNGVSTAAAGRIFTFGTAGGTLDINAILGGAGGAGGGISVALPANVAQLNSPAVIKFNGGTQGFDGSTAQASWNNGPNTLHFTNSGTGITGLNINNPVRIEITNGAMFAMDNPLPSGGTAIASPFTFAGVVGGDPSAWGSDKTTGRIAILTNTSYTFTNGLNFDAGALQVQAGGANRALLGPINFLTGANVGLMGRETGSAAISNTEANALQLGVSHNQSTITINSGATAAMDIRLRTDLAFAHGVQLFDKTNILAGGTLKFTQSSINNSATNTSGWIDVRGDIVGNGTSIASDSNVELRLGTGNTTNFTTTNGVIFAAPSATGSNLIINGTGFGGLKVTGAGRIIKTAPTTFLYGADGSTDPVGNDTKVSNFLTVARLSGLTGTGGYLTPAANGVVWNFPAGGEWAGGVSVGLKVSNSNASGNDVSIAALSSFSHNVAVESGATLDTGGSAVTLNALVTGLGTISGSGGIVVSSGSGKVAPGLNSVGTLTVGNITLNGTLEIETTSTPTTDLLNAGTLTLGGTSILNLPNTNTYSNSAVDYTIATYTSLVGSIFGTINGLPVGYSVNYGSGTNSAITLHYAAIPTDIWNGNVNSNWDVATTANWQGSTTYHDGDIAQFDNTSATQNVTITGGNVTPAAVIVSNDSSHNYTITATAGNAIIGPGALTKSGNGKLTISGPNTYSGGTNVNAGTIELGSNNALPSTGPVAIAVAGVLDVKNFNNTLADVTVTGGAVNGTGTLTVNSLTLVNNATFNPNLVLNGALTKSGTGSSALPGNVDLGGSVSRSVAVVPGTSPELTLNGVVSNGGISKSGNGMLVLGNASNSFSGGLNITAGTVQIGTAGALPSANSVTLTSGATLDGNNTAVAISGLSGTGGTVSLGTGSLSVSQTTTTSYAGAITGATASVTKTGSGELDLAGTNTFGGGLNVNGGSVRLNTTASAGTAPNTVTVGPSGTLALITGGATFVNPFVLNGGTLGNTTSTTAVTISNSLTVNANSVIDAFDPITLANGVNGQDVLITGTLHGTGGLQISSIPGNPRDANGVRLRGNATTDYSGTITVQQAAKFEIQTAIVGTTPSSPAGTALIVMNAGTNTAGSNNGTFPLFNLRNTSGGTGGSANLGNNLQITGTGVAFVNLLGTVTSALNVVDSLGSLTMSDNQTLVAASNNGVTQTLAFTSASLGGGTMTFEPGYLPGGANPYPTSENITITGSVTETAQSNLIENGIGTLTLAAGGTYTGSTTVSSGTLQVSGAISGSTALVVGGGTLKLTAANLLNHSAILRLTDSGIVNTGGSSETLGALTLAVATTTAKIDLLSAGTLTFADSSALSWTGTLEIDDWAGNPAGGGANAIFFGSSASGLTAGQLAEISFLNPAGFGAGTYSAQILSTGEVVPGVIPEPGSLATVISGLGMLLGLQRFRRRS